MPADEGNMQHTDPYHSWIERGIGSAGVPEEPIDRDALASLRELQQAGDPDLLNELVEMFLADAEPRLVSLRKAAEQKDAQAVEREAHALKGSCANFGAQPMARVCHALQVLGRAQDLRQVSKLVAHLETEYARVRAALRAELSQEYYANSYR